MTNTTVMLGADQGYPADTHDPYDAPGEFAADPDFERYRDLFLLMIESFRSETDRILAWFAEGVRRGDKGAVITGLLAASDWDGGKGTCPGLSTIFCAYDREADAARMLRDKPQL